MTTTTTKRQKVIKTLDLWHINRNKTVFFRNEINKWQYNPATNQMKKIQLYIYIYVCIFGFFAMSIMSTSLPKICKKIVNTMLLLLRSEFTDAIKAQDTYSSLLC